MKAKRTTALIVTLLGMWVLLCPVSQAEDERGPVIQGFPQASLTLFPMTYRITGFKQEYREFYDRMMGPAGQAYFKDNDILGLLLEEQGYRQLNPIESDFRFPEDEAERKDRGTVFGRFVSKQEIKTDYALCTELTFHLEKSCQEVYTVIVDAQGKVVWEDCLRAGDPDFDQEFPGTPKKCCTLVCQRLIPVMDLPSLPPAELSPEKQQLLREIRASEPPSQAEFKAMKQRLETLKQAGAAAKVLVYPVRIGGDHVDPNYAKHLVQQLNEAQLCQATLAATGPVLEGQGWPNEMKVLWIYAHAVQAYLQEHPADSDYVLFADYWLTPGGKVWAVHFILCDRTGQWLHVDLQNSHQEAFQRINPQNLEDCDRLVFDRIKTELE